MNNRSPVFILLLSSIGWGVTWWPVKQLNAAGLDSLWLLAIAFVAGALVMSPWFYLQRRVWRTKLSWMIYIALAGGIANVAFQLAIYYGDVIRVMILFYLLPVWSVFGGRLFLGEGIDGLRVLAVVLCVLGAVVILDVLAGDHLQAVSWIDVLAIVSGMALAATNILFRRVLDIPVMSKIAFMFLGSSSLIILALLLFGKKLSAVEPTILVWTVLYGAIWLTLITLGTQWAVTRMDAGRSAIIIVMELVTAVASAALIAGHTLQWHEMIGGMLVMLAVLIEGIRDNRSGKLKV